MSDRPVLFSAPMVRALIREARQPGTGKTQTRRILRLPKWASTDPNDIEFSNRAGEAEVICVETGCFAKLPVPYAVGDRLWVKEAWTHDAADLDELRAKVEDTFPDFSYGPFYRATEPAPDTMRWRTPLFMPRWASRLTLAVTEVRVERLNAISESDARAEGIKRLRSGRGFYDPTLSHDEGRAAVRFGGYFTDARAAYEALWKTLHGPGAWAENPWVAAITVRPILANIDAMAEAACA